MESFFLIKSISNSQELVAQTQKCKPMLWIPKNFLELCEGNRKSYLKVLEDITLQVATINTNLSITLHYFLI